MAYTINVVRGPDSGILTFQSGGVSVDTQCWWDKDVKVDAGSYTGYATRMANKYNADGTKRQAIWLGTGVPVNNNARKSNGIFIHKGTSAAWSDGCIVIEEKEVLKIWNAIDPKETGNITVVISERAETQSEPSRSWVPVGLTQFHWLCHGR
ncbi:MAG: L,D-transpeptidase family protein [Candidatus Competibacter sp.]|jgi:hypothetical protein